MDEYKRVTTGLEFKDGEENGAVQAIFSTFNVVDKDDDIVVPSALTHGQHVVMAWAHDWTKPVGKGQVLVQPDRAVFDGKFFLDTQAGTEAYRTVKNLGPLQEWSWGFRVLDAGFEQRDGRQVRVIKKADIYEVSPVLKGAGEGTFTLGIKSSRPLADHADTVRATVEELVVRLKSRADLSEKQGRVLSEANRRRLATLREQMSALQADLDELLAATEPEKDNRRATELERVRWETDRLLARLRREQLLTGAPS